MNGSGLSGGTLATMFEMFEDEIFPTKSKLEFRPKREKLPDGS